MRKERVLGLRNGLMVQFTQDNGRTTRFTEKAPLFTMMETLTRAIGLKIKLMEKGFIYENSMISAGPFMEGGGKTINK